MFGLCQGLSWHPGPSDRLRDDAYYEFAWAANLARGVGPVVSDGTTTSGVQLLWSLLLVPFAWLFSSAALPAIAPWLGFLLHAFTARLWFRSLDDRVLGGCVAALWLGHPLLVRECQNGQETALACLFASLLWLRRKATERRFRLLSVLAILARSDLFGLVVALSWWRHGRRLHHAALTPALALAVHLAANLALGGGPWPDSALPMAWLWRANQAAADPDGVEFWARAWWFFRPVLLGGPFALASTFGFGFLVFLLLRPRWPAALRALPALAIGCVSALGARDLMTVGWAGLLLALCPASRRRAMPWAQLALFTGVGAIVLLHWGLRWYPRDYYAAPLVVAAMATLARYGRSRLVLAVFAVSQFFDGDRVRPEPLAGQVAMQMAGRWLADAVPAGERVGCFNSGLVTFHGNVAAEPGRARAVVNLDGVVDARALAALRARGLSAWLDRERIHYVLDNPVQFALDPRLDHACGRWFGADFAPERDLVEVARFVAPGVGAGPRADDGMRLYLRVGRAERPPAAGAARDLGLGPDGARYVTLPMAPRQWLHEVTADGVRRPLYATEVTTVVWLRLPGDGRAPRDLVFDPGAQPVLRLAPL